MPALLWAAGIWWLSAQSDPPGSGLELPIAHVDKLAHASLFGVLAALLRLAGAGPWRAVGLATAWGVIDEIHQMFVPGRTPELLDVVADATGALLAVAFVQVVLVRWFAARPRPPR
ncbi:MAG: VanZ family protein [Trueperaceae bacterium]